MAAAPPTFEEKTMLAIDIVIRSFVNYKPPHSSRGMEIFALDQKQGGIFLDNFRRSMPRDWAITKEAPLGIEFTMPGKSGSFQFSVRIM